MRRTPLMRLREYSSPMMPSLHSGKALSPLPPTSGQGTYSLASLFEGGGTAQP